MSKTAVLYSVIAFVLLILFFGTMKNQAMRDAHFAELTLMSLEIPTKQILSPK